MGFHSGDLVLVPRGQKTKFFEVTGVTEGKLTLDNGWVQICKDYDEVVLICKAEERKDVIPQQK